MAVKPLFGVLYRFHRAFSWAHYHSRRRFTKPGFVMLGVAAVALMMSPDVDNNFAYQGFTIVFFTLVVSIMFGWRFRGNFSVERHLPRFGTAGKPVSYTISVRNLSKRTQKGLSILETLTDPRPAFPDWLEVQLAEERQMRSFRPRKRKQTPNPYKLADVKEGFLPPIPPGQEAEGRLELTPLRRGILRFSGVTLGRADPFGLCRALKKIRAPQTMVILPKRYHLPQIALPGTLKYQDGGVAMASKVGQSDEFIALRDYRYGDPPRHIHWRSWAKSAKPVVKEFEDEFFVRHALILDTFTDMPHSEVFEEAISVAASFACTLETQESLLDLLFVGTESFCFTAGRGLSHADQMLEVLASVKPCTKLPFSRLEHLVLDRVSAVSGCVCVFITWDERRKEFVRKLESFGLPVLVLWVAQAGTKRPSDREISSPDRFHILHTGAIESGLAVLR